MKSDKFWIPSQNKATLLDQLSQKKFREIFKDQIEYVVFYYNCYD